MAFLTVSFFPEYQSDLAILSVIGKKLLIGVLFIVGLNFSIASIREVGTKPIKLAVTLWAIVIIFSLAVLKLLPTYF